VIFKEATLKHISLNVCGLFPEDGSAQDDRNRDDQSDEQNDSGERLHRYHP